MSTENGGSSTPQQPKKIGEFKRITGNVNEGQNQLWDKISGENGTTKKMAVYSGNLRQRNAIEKGERKVFTWRDKKQAVIFRELHDTIWTRGVRERIKINTLPTSLHGGSNPTNNIVSKAHLDASLKDLAYALGAGWEIHILAEGEKGRFKIGGGVTRWFDSQPLDGVMRNPNGRLTTQGEYVQRTLRTLEKIGKMGLKQPNSSEPVLTIEEMLSQESLKDQEKQAQKDLFEKRLNKLPPKIRLALLDGLNSQVGFTHVVASKATDDQPFQRVRKNGKSIRITPQELKGLRQSAREIPPPTATEEKVEEEARAVVISQNYWMGGREDLMPRFTQLIFTVDDSQQKKPTGVTKEESEQKSSVIEKMLRGIINYHQSTGQKKCIVVIDVSAEDYTQKFKLDNSISEVVRKANAAGITVIFSVKEVKVRYFPIEKSLSASCEFSNDSVADIAEEEALSHPDQPVIVCTVAGSTAAKKMDSECLLSCQEIMENSAENANKKDKGKEKVEEDTAVLSPGASTELLSDIETVRKDILDFIGHNQKFSAADITKFNKTFDMLRLRAHPYMTVAEKTAIEKDLEILAQRFKPMYEKLKGTKNAHAASDSTAEKTTTDAVNQWNTTIAAVAKAIKDYDNLRRFTLTGLATSNVTHNNIVHLQGVIERYNKMIADASGDDKKLVTKQAHDYLKYEINHIISTWPDKRFTQYLAKELAKKNIEGLTEINAALAEVKDKAHRLENFWLKDKAIPVNKAGDANLYLTMNEIRLLGDEALEKYHNYVQWLFPSNSRSGADKDAPKFEEMQAKFDNNKESYQAQMKRNFIRMMQFYGIEVIETNDGVTLQKAADFDKKAQRWLSVNNHNHLRLSRIIESLGLFGLDTHKKALSKFLLVEIAQDPKYSSSISNETLNNWWDKSGLEKKAKESVGVGEEGKEKEKEEEEEAAVSSKTQVNVPTTSQQLFHISSGGTVDDAPWQKDNEGLLLVLLQSLNNAKSGSSNQIASVTALKNNLKDNINLFWGKAASNNVDWSKVPPQVILDAVADKYGVAIKVETGHRSKKTPTFFEAQAADLYRPVKRDRPSDSTEKQKSEEKFNAKLNKRARISLDDNPDMPVIYLARQDNQWKAVEPSSKERVKAVPQSLFSRLLRP